MKKTRIIALALAVLLLLLTFAGCAQKNGSTAPHSLDDLKVTDTLVLYIQENSESQMRRMITQYEELYGVNVETVVVEGGAQAYAERVANDLAGGTGPDVLFIKFYDYMDIAKTALNYNFLDLTDVLADDPDFSEDDYVAGVFDACRFGGRQYTVPLSFSSPLYLSAKTNLEELGFSGERIAKTSDFIEELTHLTPYAEQNADFKQMMWMKDNILDFLFASGISLLDYENQVVLPDEEAFRELIHTYKIYFPYDYNESGVSTTSNFGADDLIGKKYFFWPVYGYIADLAWNIDTLEEASCGYTLYTIPSQTGEIVGSIYEQMAISANSKNSLNAYNFIKMLLSEEIQTGYSSSSRFLPIHKEAIKTTVYGAFQWDVLHEGETYTFSGYRSDYLSSEELDAIIETITNVDRFTQPALNATNMMYECMLPFFKDEKSYEDCLADLKNKLMFYISE